MEEIEIGPTPSEEMAAQVGRDDFTKIYKEAIAYKNQILRHYPMPETGCGIKVKRFSHDFGSYAEVVLKFNPTSEAACEWAFAVEGDDKNVLRLWDSEARSELGMDPCAYVIYSANEASRNEGAGFWSNQYGWTLAEGATQFTEAERQTLSLPIAAGSDATWKPIAQEALAL